jgi:hypothetical protein
MTKVIVAVLQCVGLTSAATMRFATTTVDRDVLAQGDIDSSTVAAFNAYKNAHPNVRRVILDSAGGNVLEALALGRAIRQAGLDTYVGGTYKTPSEGYSAANLENMGECYSACVWVFAGGVHRFFDAMGGVIGVHQFSSEGTHSDQIATGEMTAQYLMTAIGLYLDEMGVSRTLLDWAALVPPNTIQPLPRAVAERLRLDNTGRQRTTTTTTTRVRGPDDPLRVMLIRQSSLGFVNVREGPKISSPVVDKAYNGMYTVGKVIHGWYEIKDLGWVAGKYVIYVGRPLSREQCPQMTATQREVYGKCR